MSSEYGQAVYRARKQYLSDYYWKHKEELSKKAHERYIAKKEMAKRAREDLKSQICNEYCRYACELDAVELEGKCEGCPLVRLK